jgi:hypothetical protein
MCLNGQHPWTMSRWAALADQYGAALFALSRIRVECRTGEVNGTTVLLVLDIKAICFNGIAEDSIEEGYELLNLFPIWSGLDKHCSFRVPFPCLTVLRRHP